MALIGEAGVGKSRLSGRTQGACRGGRRRRRRCHCEEWFQRRSNRVPYAGDCFGPYYGPRNDEPTIAARLVGRALPGDGHEHVVWAVRRHVARLLRRDRRLAIAPCDAAQLACALRDGLQSFRDDGHLRQSRSRRSGRCWATCCRCGSATTGTSGCALPIRADSLSHLRRAAAFFGALARRQPTVLVLEDLHWADSLSVDLIGELLGLLADHPLLLLCVYRPGREYPSERLAAVAERRCQDRLHRATFASVDACREPADARLAADGGRSTGQRP